MLYHPSKRYYHSTCKSIIGKTIISILVCFISHGAIGQYQKYKPIILDSGSTLSFAPDLRLKTGIEGSIEIQAAFRKISTANNSTYTILLNGNNEQEQYKISVMSGLKTIHFSCGKSIGSWMLPFTDTNFHQLVFVTHKNHTDFYCDAKKIPPYNKSLKITYAPGYDFKNELRIGDENNEDVRCKVRTLRLWNYPLKERTISQVALNYGAPRAGNITDDSLFAGLIGYSFFTMETESFFYTNPDIQVTEYAGVAHGDYYVFTNDGSREKQPAEIVSMMIINNGKGIGPVLPVIAKAKANRSIDSSLAYTQAPSRSLNKVKGFDTTNYPMLYGSLNAFTKNTSMPKSIRIDTVLMKHKNIERVFGTYNGSHLLSLNFVTTANDTIKVASAGTDGHLQTFCIDIPRFAEFRGFILRQDSLTLNAIALLYSVDIYATEDFTLLNRINASGHWYGLDQKPPQRTDMYDSSNFTNIHGNYSTPPVYTIRDIIKDSIYVVYVDSGTAATNTYFKVNKTQFSTFKKQPVFTTSDSALLRTYADTGWHYINGNATMQSNATGFMIHRDSVTDIKLPSQLVRPGQKSSAFPDKIAWGGTFSQEQRPALSRANFVGYNLFKMDPRNFQNAVYSSKEIFAYPKEGSYSYYSTDNRVIVPNGLFYRNDNVGIEKMKTVTTDSTSSYSSSWGVQLGFNIGIPEVFSFAANAKYQSEMHHAFESKRSKTLARTVVGKYALVLDKATMPLSKNFRLAVLKLRNDFINGFIPDYWGIVKQFGTHYAYAVTYGGMAYLEVTSIETDTSTKFSNSIKIQAKAGGIIEGLSLGGSAGYSGGFKLDTAKISNVENVKFGTFGGSMSTGEAWSLQKGEEVPILMDLRPIWDLFSPTFFDDPLIWTSLRDGLQESILNGIVDTGDVVCPNISTQLTIVPPKKSEDHRVHLLYKLPGGQQIDTVIATTTTITIPYGSTGLTTILYEGNTPIKPFPVPVPYCLPPIYQICVDFGGKSTPCQ